MPGVLAIEVTGMTWGTVQEFLQKRASDPVWKTKACMTGQLGPKYEEDSFGSVVRKSVLDERLQRVVLRRMQAVVLYSAHYRQGLSENPGGLNMTYKL